MRTVVLLTLAVALFGLCFAMYVWQKQACTEFAQDALATLVIVADTVGPDVAHAAALFKAWMCEFVRNLYADVKKFGELLHTVGKLINRSNTYALEGHEDWRPTTRAQEKWSYWWYTATHQDTCKRVFYYTTFRTLTGLHGLKGVAEAIVDLAAKAGCMYVKLVQWHVLLRGMLSACRACVRCAPPVDVQSPSGWWARLVIFGTRHALRFVCVLWCMILYHTNLFARLAYVHQKIMDPGHDDLVEAWARAENKTCLSMFYGWFAFY